MGEGVTNPVGGAASSSADLSVEEPVASLLYAVRIAACWKLVLLLSLSCVVALGWTSRRRRRKKLCVSDQTSIAKQSPECDVTAETDNLTQKLLQAPSEKLNDSLPLSETQNISPHTGSAVKSAPRLRRSVSACERGDSVSSLNKQLIERCTSFSTLELNTEVGCIAGSQLLSNMDPKDIPGLPEPQPDSFFTWDSGGSSGEYSFVHTAVELPKYPDGAISEEERQMLLLYMQNGHPELLLNSASGSVNSQSLMNSSITDSILCDQAAVRGFLETIVEENSDDLKSPSECDETSLGWGSWDESDDDRVTVVEMQTSTTNGSQNSSEPLHIPLHSDDTLLDKKCVSLTNEFPDKQENKGNFSDISVIATGDNLRNQIHENELSGRKANEKHSVALTGETSVKNFSLQVLAQQNGKGGVLCVDNEMLSPECVKFCESKNQQIHFGESSAMDASEVSPSFNPLSLDKNDFETLWISANELEYPIETVNPWCENTGLNSESSKDCPLECKNSDFFENNEECSLADSSLIVLGSENDLCLVPSKITQNAPESKENVFMFSDDFKDYFLPSENYVPGFNRDITEINKENVFVTENISAHLPFATKNKGLRCFRIGFDSRLANEKQVADEDNSGSDVKMSRINSEFENSESPDLQEAVFSPRDGDVVYGSTWLSKPELKEQEKATSGAEARLTTMQADVQCTMNVQSESPPPDNSRKSIPCLEQSASDDEMREVPNSLSRWQHHSDLQHVQEATSPITRWQHQTDLQMLGVGSASKQNIHSDDESDDGLPPQLKHIYSSFKMKDKKMSRIRIKEDKNNNFKTLGLWDNETKVTLPPFGSNNNESEITDPKHSEKNTLENKEEDLDDLELDMFAVNSDNTGSSSRSLLNDETDIDDALKSFKHLDDYSSHSEENSETESSYIINTREDINITEGKLTRDSSIEIGDTEQNNSDNSSIEEPNKLGTLSPENTCSDNSDNCPLCTDPSFKKSNINNLIFSESANEEFMDSRVQSLFLNTFPTMLSLSQPNLCNNNASSDALTEKEPTDSPLTSSDSDEGIRAAKETKKRIKKRSKDNCNLELKHDDSGYVEDDEDDDEDDILCEKERNDLVTQLAPKSWEIADLANVRKSISSVFYESKSDRSRHANEGVQSDSIPQSFQEFSKPLDHSISNNDSKFEHIDSEKWNIPENLSQFSAWLLDKELKKISCRDEMEKLIVSDIMSLREQTIAQFLKNSANFQEKDIFKLPEIFENKVSINTKNIKEEILNIGSRDLNSESKHSSLITPVFNDTLLNFETGAGTNMQNVAMANTLTENKVKNNSDGSLSDEKLELSTDELSEEYYNYNFNNQVSKVFNLLDENYRRKSDSNAPLAEENCIKSLTYTKENDLKYSSNNSNTQQIVANNLSKVQHTRCDLELNAYKSDASNYMNDKSELGDCKNDSQIIETRASMNEVLSESTQHESETNAQSEGSCQLTSGLVGDTTTGIQSKVIDTTTLITSASALGDAMNNINKIKSNSSLVAPSNIRDGVHNTNNSDKLTDTVKEKNINDVAPSIEDELNKFCIKSGNGLVGADDLMTCGMYERKGAYQCSVEEGENNTSLAATRGETSEGKHVRGDSCHACCCNDISTCSALLATQSSAFDNVSSSLSLCTGLLLDEIDTTLIDNSKIKQLSNISSDFDVEANIGSEKSPVLHITKVYSCTALDANDNTQPPVLDYTEFSLDDLENSINKDCALGNTDVNGEFTTSNVFENAILNIHSANSESSDASKHEDPLISKLDKTLESNTQANNNHRENTSNELAINLIEENKSKPDIISTCTESVSNSKLNSEFIGGRVGYERSQSVDRDTASSKETLEVSVGQSKSTPDLRRCHEQQYNSSVPLSALLSKSVSQRIQDYLGHSTRGGFLNRSLPPTERSRHYRRICVSTETVVERAARFEARSRSTCGPREGSVDSLASASRSGSCPPLNMRSRTLDAWNSDKSSRNYNKPTATVRPTVDAYRSSSYLKQYSTADDKGFNNGVIKNNLSSKDDLMELITGYTEATKVTHKPPVPPSSSTTTQLHQSLKSARLKGKIASARKDFFERLSQQDLRSKDETKQSNSENLDFESGGLQRFDEFRRSAREERVRLAASHPDLGALEAAVRSSKRKIDQLKKKKKSGAVAGQAPLDAGPPQQSNSDMPSTTTTKDASLCLPYRRCTGEIAWASCAKRLQEAKAKSKGNLAQEQLEIVDVVHEQRSFWFKQPAETGDVRAQRPDTAGEDDYYDDDDPASSHSNGGDSAIAAAVVENSEFLGTRARSMDFLLDADNREKVQPPENRLATGQGRVKSEHELRIERSLQNLTIPDWYKQSAWSKKPKEGFILRRGSEGSAGESRKRWQGFSSSRTPSATSLTTPPSSYSHRNIIVPKRVTPTSTEWRYVGSLVSSRESLTPASPSSLSPRECASATFQYGLNSSLSRWSSSRLSTSSAPLTALSVHRSFRQPYLGWRAAQASSGYTPSSGGASRSSPGVSPVAATTPVQGSRSESPRRGSQEHHYGYGLQQNQITSAATLRPDGSETADSSSRISPLALYDNTTNVFFNSNVEIPHSDSHAFDQQQRFSSAEMRRDRYSYTQSLYSGTVIVSPGTADDDRRNYNVDQVPRIVPGVEEERFSIVKSPQPPPRIWMESSFVGTKKDGSEPVLQPTRSIRIVPSDSVRAGTDKFSSARGSTSSSLRGTCATQTSMDTRELIDHLHNFLRGLQNRNQMIRPSSTSAFTPVSSSSNSGFHQTTNSRDDVEGSQKSCTNLNVNQHPHLVEYESEPKAYPRGSWRHSSSSSKDISPDNSSTDNELWLSVGEDIAAHKIFRTTPEHLDGRSSSRSSISPPSPPMLYSQQHQKRVSEDSTGSGRPIFFASSRRGSKGSNQDSKSETSCYSQQQRHSINVIETHSTNRDEFSRKSSLTHSEESGFFRRDSKSGGSSSWRTDQESSSATTSRGEKSSASMEEVLESLLAIPPSSSRSSSPTSPRRSRGPGMHMPHRQSYPGMRTFPTSTSTQDESRFKESEENNQTVSTSRPVRPKSAQCAGDDQRGKEDVSQSGNDQGKTFDDRLKFPSFPSRSTSTTATQKPSLSSPLEEVNLGSFCRSSSTSPLEDDVQSPTSMEVLVPEGEEQELSSIIEDDAKISEDFEKQDHHQYHSDQHVQLHQPLRGHHHPLMEQPQRPPLQRQSTLPSCCSSDPLSQQPQEDVCANLFAGLQPGSYSRGIAEGTLRRPQSLCLVLLHLPCMFCARALAPPPTDNSFSNGPTRMTCVSEPSTPVRELVCSSYEPGSCCGEPVNRVISEPTRNFYLTNLGSNPGRGPSVNTTTTEDKGTTQEASGTTPSRKKKSAAGGTGNVTTNEGHLKCHRPKCTKSLPVEEARAKFRTCPNCYTYYCSRQCRKLHLARHKDHCPQTRISNLCKQVLMKARDDPVSRRHLSLCAKRGLLSRGRGAVKLLFLNPEDALDYLVHGWESAKGQTLYVSRSDLLPQEMGSDVFSQVRNFCDKYNPERKFILLAAITVTNEIAAALEREVVVRGAKMHLSPSLPEDDVQTLILTITKTDPQTGDPAQTTIEDRRKGLSIVIEQLSTRGVDLEKLYPHTYRKILRYVEENEPFSPISIFPTDQRNGRVFMCIILPWADADIIVNISSKGGASTAKSSKKKWIL